VHKNLTLVGIGLAGGFVAGRFPRQTRSALTKAAQTIETRTIRRDRTPPAGTQVGLGTVIEESPFPPVDPPAE
jgi:hypothetical protein